MFSFFKKQTRIKPDLSFLGADMHSHLLPELDDGVQDLETTLAFIGELYEMGYKKLICTPHIISDMYPNSPETIFPKLEVVRQALEKANIPIIIEAAAEYMVDHEMGNSLKQGDKLLTFGKNMILIEMSYIAPSPNFDEVVFGLRVKGIQPVVAHPERYNFYHNDFSRYEHMVEMGCLLQVNLLSLLGYYGKPVKMIAEKLFAKKMVSLLGTDMHHENHLLALKELVSRKEFYNLIEGADLKNNTLL